MTTTKREKGSSIVRVLDMLEAVALAERPMSPTDLAYELDIPKATAHRLVQTLESEGFLQINMRGNLVVGERLTDIALGVLHSGRHKAQRRAVLENLAASTGETCGISLPDGTEMIYYDRVQANWPLQVYLPVGSRVPVACTSGGKLYMSQMPPAQLKRFLNNLPLIKRARNTITDPDVLLEDIDRTRASGIGLDNEEFIDGMVACSIPITVNGRLHASLFCHAPVLRRTIDDMKALAPELQIAAQKLQALLESTE